MEVPLHTLTIDTVPAEVADWPVKRYAAAGGVVMYAGRILLILRRAEVRLPKGHIEPGETAEDCAVREVREETGLQAPRIVAFLGKIDNHFPHNGTRYERQEYWFAMHTDDDALVSGEAQWTPVWRAVSDALAELTYEPERVVVQWLRERFPELDSG